MSESGGNGKLIPEQEEMVKIKDLIIAVKRNDDGNLETFVAPQNRSELEIALMRLTHTCFGFFNAMSRAQQELNKSKIIKPQGSIMDFVRRRKS